MAVGATQKLIETKQTEFATSMLKRLREEKGSKFIDFTDKKTIKGSSEYVFYVMGESTVRNGELNMYADSYAGTGGEAKKVSCTIDYVYADDKIKKKDLNATTLDLESPMITSLVEALKRNVDKKIIDAIVAKGFNAVVGTEEEGKCVLVGDATKTLADQANVETIIESVAYLMTLAKETSVEGTDVAIVLDAAEYAALYKAEKFVNDDYAKFKTLLGGAGSTLLGAEVIKVPAGAKAKGGIFLVARGVIGTAAWENDVEAGSEWSFGQDSLFLKAQKSLGVAILDEKAIYKVQYKV